ncbi:hypothetical protein MBLNU230_g1930t1 [Neophaeotheca triangularis]
MASTVTTQAFYSLTLSSPTATTCAVSCNVLPDVSSNDAQILEARGTRLFLHQVVNVPTARDPNAQAIQTFLEHDTFGIVRQVAAYRIASTERDTLVITTDSGKITCLQYDADNNTLKIVSQETYGKSGIRRVIPGQYLAADPRGRCFMIASTEKNKVVYMQQKSPDGISTSSPQEANQQGAICFAMTALDTNWEHPVFATLDVDYIELENDHTGEAHRQRQKLLKYYTADLGINHVVMSWSTPVDYSAHMLFGVPGGTNGPGGVIVCAQNRIYYHHDKQTTLCVPIPKREGPTEDKGRTHRIVAGAVNLTRSRHDFFLLLQEECGDVFILTFDYHLNEQGQNTFKPKKLILKYYDTFPVARSIVIIRKGYFYFASENGANRLYRIDSIADDPDVEPEKNFTSDGITTNASESIPLCTYTPRGLLHTALEAESPSLHPLMRARVDDNLGVGFGQIYTIQGTGNASRMKGMRHGLKIDESTRSPANSVAPMSDIFTMRQRATDPYHTHVLLSSKYAERTVALELEGENVASNDNTRFLTNRATIAAQQMGEAALMQVHSKGIHTILPDGRINTWEAPSNRSVLACAANQYQCVLGLSTLELAFFFSDPDGNLTELEERPQMSGQITCLAVAPTPEGSMQSKFGVVGCDDSSIRVFSIEIESPLEMHSIQAVNGIPSSCKILSHYDPATGGSVMMVHIGMKNGIYLRAVVDEHTGDLSDVRTRFIGHEEVHLYVVEVEGQDCVMPCSSTPSLAYNHPATGHFTVTPLDTQQIVSAANFHTEEGRALCCLTESDLMMFNVRSLSGRIIEESVRLENTPRNFSKHPHEPFYYIAEADANTMSKQTVRSLMAAANASIPDEEMDGVQQDLPEEFGLPRGPGHWASSVQVVDMRGSEGMTFWDPHEVPSEERANYLVTCTIDLDENEAAMSIACVSFASRNDEPYVIVGTGQHIGMPHQKGFVHAYRLLNGGRTLQFMHKTEFKSPVLALCATSDGRVAFGVGKELIIYDIGNGRMLRKSRCPEAASNRVVSILNHRNRFIVGDVKHSQTYITYKPTFNRLIPFIEDVTERYTTSSALLDYETVAMGDKFGSLVLLRCPSRVSAETDDVGTSGHIANERSYLSGAPYRLELQASYFLNDIPTTILRTPLVAGGEDLLVWAGLQGTLGFFVPFSSRTDADLFEQLQSQLRAEAPPLSGRDHIAFRGYYQPVKSVIDGDLCERFLELGAAQKARIAEAVGRGVREVEKKVLEMRSRVAY